MLALSLCLICLAGAYFAGRRSLTAGLLVVIATGYLYGILRANLLSPFAHFSFDAALLGLYASQRWDLMPGDQRRIGPLRAWTGALIVWPLIVAFLPFQTPLVTIAGLRANIVMLPALLLGARLRGKDLMNLAYGLTALNLLALGLAVAEYILGVERFFPPSELTSIILGSGDVAGGFLRIPSTFINSAAYAGTMVTTLPLLFGASSQATLGRLQKLFIFIGLIAALMGVLMGASRSHFLVASILVAAAVFGSHLSPKHRLISVVSILVLAGIAVSNQRFQRFESLADSNVFATRIGGSVNRTFWEIVTEYPMGNGLGAIGTGVPSFLMAQIKLPIVMENEFARIVLEEGLIGLLLWALFILWVVSRRTPFQRNSWRNGRRLVWFFCLAYFGSGMIGTGLLTSIPYSFLVFLFIGWIMVPQNREIPLRQNALRSDRITSSPRSRPVMPVTSEF